jgi:AcrR family transcriptional regulator
MPVGSRSDDRITDHKVKTRLGRRYGRCMATDARERILEAACDLIASDGIDDVRIARVATRARASTALVHHYFSTREELLEQALIHSFETAGQERFAEEPEAELSPSRGLSRAIEACLPLPGAQERDWTLWVELWLRAVRDPVLRPLAADLYGRYREWFATFIGAGLESGEFRSPKPVDELADLAVALVDGLGVRALIADPQMDVGRARRLVAAHLAEELGVEPSALLASG